MLLLRFMLLLQSDACCFETTPHLKDGRSEVERRASLTVPQVRGSGRCKDRKAGENFREDWHSDSRDMGGLPLFT